MCYIVMYAQYSITVKDDLLPKIKTPHAHYYELSNNRPGRLFFFNFFAVPGRSYSSWSIINVQESHRPTPCLRIPFFFLAGVLFFC